MEILALNHISNCEILLVLWFVPNDWILYVPDLMFIMQIEKVLYKYYHLLRSDLCTH